MLFFVPRLLPLSIIALLVSAIPGLDGKSVSLKQITLPMFLLIAFFVWNAIGLFYSADVPAGTQKVTTKLSFLVFPLIFWIRKDFYLNRASVLLHAMVVVAVASAVFLFGFALFNYLNEFHLVKTGVVYDRYINLNYFFTTLLSPWIHPGYISLYYCIAIWLVLEGYGYFPAKRKKFFSVLSLLLFATTIFFLASKAGLLVCLSILCIAFLNTIRQRIQSRMIFYLMLGGFIAVSVLVASASEIVRHKFESMVQSFSTSAINKKSNESNDVRKAVIKASTDLFAESPYIGYGTGDVQTTLDSYYKKNEFEVCLEHHYNSHNQFLQTGLALGAGCVLLLVFIYLLPFYLGVSSYPLLAVLTFAFFASSMIESVFETQAGTVFFAYFYCVFSLIGLKRTN